MVNHLLLRGSVSFARRKVWEITIEENEWDFNMRLISRYTGIALVFLDEEDMEYYASVPCFEFYIPHCTYRTGQWYWKKSDRTTIILNKTSLMIAIIADQQESNSFIRYAIRNLLRRQD